jgi:serine/threonine protein kinase/Tfp pilus assembly protein PilF
VLTAWGVPEMCPSEEDFRHYLDEELGATDRSVIDAHLKDCPQCLEVLQAMIDADAGEIAAELGQLLISPRPQPPAADPAHQAGFNMLFGVLALQNNFIGRDDLLTAFTAWVADKARPLAQILVERGSLDGTRRALLEALVDEHLKQHGGDPAASLGSVNSLGLVRRDLEQIGDADLQASLTATVSQPGRPGGDAGPKPAPSSSPRRAGQRFRILRFHDKGGLGQVSVALDEELGREVALKEILPDQADDADLRGRFVLEAEINGGLEHPGIVPVYSHGTNDDGRPFYAMRFVEGDSLEKTIELYHEKHPQPDPTAVEFRKLLVRFVAICEAIAFAHSKGVLHRDLKPRNVMLGRFGETLLIDWGLAKATGRRQPVSLEAIPEKTLLPPSGIGHAPTQGMLGSPPYTSPEQAALAFVKDKNRLKEAVESLGSATDVYGLGAILFALLTSESPVERKGEILKILDQVQRGEIRQPRLLNPNIPRALEAVCLKSLAKKPEDRYPSALALAEDLENWLADEPVSAWPEPWPIRFRRWAKLHRTTIAAATAMVVALAALSGAYAWNEGRIQDKVERNVRAMLANPEYAQKQRVARDRAEPHALEELRAMFLGLKALLGTSSRHNDLKGQIDDRSERLRSEAELAVGDNETVRRAYIDLRTQSPWEPDKVIPSIVEVLNRVIARRSDHPLAHVGLATYELSECHWDNWVPAWRNAASKAHDPRVDEELARVLTGQGLHEEALAVLRDPTRGATRLLRAKIQGISGRWEEALKELHTITAIPRPADVPRDQVDEWLELCSGPAPKFMPREVLSDAGGFVSPDVVRRYTGQILFAIGRYDEAIECLGEATTRNPQNPAPHLCLSLVFRGTSQLDRMRAEIKLYSEDSIPESMRFFPAETKAKLFNINMYGSKANCESLVSLEGQLDGFLCGRVGPKSTQERLAFAELSYHARHYATAARSFAEVLRPRPHQSQAEIEPFQLLIALRSAALVASGKGGKDPSPDEKTRAQCGEQSLNILTAIKDYYLTNVCLANADPRLDPLFEQALLIQTMKSDPDISGVRDEMPGVASGDRDAWKNFWKKVDTWLDDVQQGRPTRRYIARLLMDRSTLRRRPTNGTIADCIADCTEAIRVDPTYIIAYHTLAELCFKEGEYEKAIANYTKAIHLNPENADAYNNRGVALVRKKEYDKAIADFDNAIRINPDYDRAYRNRGDAWLAKKEYDKAIADYNKIITTPDIKEAIINYKELDVTVNLKISVSDAAAAHNNRGAAWYYKKEYERAIVDYSMAIQLEPEYAAAYHWRGAAWYYKKEYERAIADYSESIRLEPKQPEFSNGLAWLLATCPDAKYRDGKKAVELATRACELTKWQASNVIDTLAAAYAEAGDFDAALKWQTKVNAMYGNAENRAKGQERLKLYREKKPYRRTNP